MKTSASIVTEFVTLAGLLRDSYYEGGYPTIGSAIDAIDEAIGDTFGGAVYAERKLYVTHIARTNQTQVDITVYAEVDTDFAVKHSYNVWYDNYGIVPVALKYRLTETHGTLSSTVAQYTNFQNGEYRIYES